MKTALLIVDVQRALIDGHPYDEANFLERLKKLIGAARNNGADVVYVRHNGGKGSPLAYGEPGFEIHPAIAPMRGEMVFDKKYNSAFKETELAKHLNARGIERLVLAGMQTEYCIDATCKSAFERGYSVVIPEGGSTTYDNPFFTAEKLIKFYEKMIWNRNFAGVAALEDAVGALER
jgi:nicotinamidase-related amidase